MASTSQATDSSTPDDEEGVREESFFKALADLKKVFVLGILTFY